SAAVTCAIAAPPVACCQPNRRPVAAACRSVIGRKRQPSAHCARRGRAARFGNPPTQGIRSMRHLLLMAAGALACCVPPAASAAKFLGPDPYPSTYKPLPSEPVLLRNATVLTGTGQRLDNADVLMRDGRIEAVGPGLQAPADARVVDATGKWVTPGVIDVHSHLGVYPSPGVRAHSDGNEMTSPVTANVWAEHSVWPQDPGFAAALAAGVTTLQILPGSANLVGGR